MFCISISFRKVPLDIRQKFAFTAVEQDRFLKQLQEQNMISGGVVVSTCNRSEIYFTGEEMIDGEGPMEQVEQALSLHKQVSLEYIRKYGLYYTGRKAVRHLYKVTCGLDSMVLGEDEILHQVKEAYLLAKDGGHANSELNMIFQGALNCAKLSKSNTKLSNTPLSIGTLTANTIEDYLNEMCNGNDKPYEVLVIGATGKIGSVVTKDLIAKGIRVLGTRRTHQSQEGVFVSEQMEWINFKDRYDYLTKVNVIVSATASPHYTLTVEEFEKNRGDLSDKLLVDLAVPYDIDKEIRKLPHVTGFDIDHFKALAKENRNIKQGELEKVGQILDECVEEVLKKLYLRDFKKKMETQCEAEWFRKMTYYLKEVLDSEQFSLVLGKIYETEKGEA